MSVLTPQVCSLTVTHEPILDDGTLRDQLKYLIEAKILPILIDNNSSNITQIEEMAVSISSTITILRLEKNYGIGAALNLGISKCLQRDSCRWILTLDQDSVIEVKSLNSLYERLSCNNTKKADIYGLNYRTNRFNREKIINNTGEDYYTDFVITSGMLTNRLVYETIKYNEELFMYFIDNDFCARAKEHGYTIIQCFSAQMEHHEGERLVKGKDTFYVMKPSSIFFVSRNSLYMFFEYYKITPVLYAFLVTFENTIASYFLVSTLSNFINGFFNGIIRKISE